MITFGISTWSLHRSLQSGLIDLLDIPAQVRDHGMTQLHLCHFHLDQSDVEPFRVRLETACVTLDTLLLDFGDLSHPEQSGKDLFEYERWMEIASMLGAKHARISAGNQQPTEATLARSAKHLLHLADVGEHYGVRVITENWNAMTPGSAELLRLHQLTHGRIPICVDTGNWTGATKYAELEKIAPLAMTVHAKCDYSDAETPDETDFLRCLEILQRANFGGAIALIYSGPSADEWRYLDEELAMARRIL